MSETTPGLQTQTPMDGEAASLVRHEEELSIGKTETPIGVVRVRKSVESEAVDAAFPKRVEYAGDAEVVPAGPTDSGQVETLSDGSVSIPIFEERLVVSKQTYVKERVIVRKNTVTEEEMVHETLLREEVDVHEE